MSFENDVAHVAGSFSEAHSPGMGKFLKGPHRAPQPCRQGRQLRFHWLAVGFGDEASCVLFST